MWVVDAVALPFWWMRSIAAELQPVYCSVHVTTYWLMAELADSVYSAELLTVPSAGLGAHTLQTITLDLTPRSHWRQCTMTSLLLTGTTPAAWQGVQDGFWLRNVRQTHTLCFGNCFRTYFRHRDVTVVTPDFRRLHGYIVVCCTGCSTDCIVVQMHSTEASRCKHTNDKMYVFGDGVA